MKKIISIIVAVMLMTGSLSACSNNSGNNTDADKLQIVTTIFPEYDWVKTILGEKADQTDLTLLLDNGVDLHSYQPSIDDILKISSCDLFKSLMSLRGPFSIRMSTASSSEMTPVSRKPAL